MNGDLTYRPREGVVFGAVAGRTIRLATLRNHAGLDIEAWRQAAQSAGAAETRVTDWSKAQELRVGSSTAGAVRHRLTVAEQAAFELYERPATYAPRPAGVGQGGAGGSSASHPLHARVVWLKVAARTGFPDSGFCLHGAPACASPRCVVIIQEWDSLFQALKTVSSVSLAIEL